MNILRVGTLSVEEEAVLLLVFLQDEKKTIYGNHILSFWFL